MSCPYAYFGLTPEAHPEVVKLAVRLALVRDHPDKGGSAAALQRTQEARQAIRAGTPLTTHPRATRPLGQALTTAFAPFRRKPAE